MILGYEQPVAIPGMLVYDKDTLKMYLGALLKDYEEGLEAEKEFYEKYAGFLSPSAKDTENYYNLSLGPIQLYLNLNPDAIRSVDGRALLRRLMNSIPYDKLAQIRQTAATGDLYRKALLQGVANGTLDYATAIALDGDINNWDTLSQGSWNKVAPTAQKSVNEVLSPYIEDLVKHGYEYDQAASNKRGQGWLVKTVSDKKILDQIGQHSADILRDPMMQLRIRQSGLTPEQYLKSEIYQHMRDELPAQETENKTWMDLLKLGIDKAQLGIARQSANTAAYNAETSRMNLLLSTGKYQLDDNGKLVKATNTTTVPPTTHQDPPTTHQDVDNAAVSKRNITLGGGSNGGNEKNWKKALDNYMDYYANLAENPKLAEEALKRLNWARRVKEEGFSKAIKNGFFTKNQYGDLIATAAWLNAYTTVQTNSFITKPKYAEATNRAISYRNTYKTNITDDYDRKIAANRFAGTSVIDNNMTPGDGIRNRQVSLAQSDIIFTPYRAQYLAGVKKFRDADYNIAERFDRFVHKNLLTGFFTNGSYSKMLHVSSPRVNGGRSFDIDAPVLINHSDLKAFATSIGRGNDVAGVARDLGLTPRTLRNKEITETGKNAGKTAWRNADYYEADFTRVENNNNTSSAGDYDYQVDKERYGLTNAFKLAMDRKARSANRK